LVGRSARSWVRSWVKNRARELGWELGQELVGDMVWELMGEVQEVCDSIKQVQEWAWQCFQELPVGNQV
jgi:hypothetical protein